MKNVPRKAEIRASQKDRPKKDRKQNKQEHVLQIVKIFIMFPNNPYA